MKMYRDRAKPTYFFWSKQGVCFTKNYPPPSPQKTKQKTKNNNPDLLEVIFDGGIKLQSPKFLPGNFLAKVKPQGKTVSQAFLNRIFNHDTQKVLPKFIAWTD